jgi:hypothetical protein
MTPGNYLKTSGSGMFQVVSPNLPKESEVNLEKKLRLSDVSTETRTEGLPKASLQDYPATLPSLWARLSGLNMEERKIHIKPWL